MGSFITLDIHELLNGELGVRESGGGKITFFKLGKSFSIKLGLELLQNIREFCERVNVSSGRSWLRSKTRNRHKEIEKERFYALRTNRFVAESCLFHGAAATKSGAARAMIEATKRIVLNEIKGWMGSKKRDVLLETLFQTKGRPAG